MKTEELRELGLSDEQISAVFKINGTDIEKQKKRITDLEAERDGLKTRLDTAESTLKNFDGIDPEKIQAEIQAYKKQAEDAERNFNQQLTQRDQRDWIAKKLDEYGVKSPFARKQLTADCMSADSGLTWKDGTFFGFDDFMKAAKEQDNGLYQTAEEKEAAEKAAALEQKAARFTGPVGNPQPAAGTKKYVPPKIF